MAQDLDDDDDSPQGHPLLETAWSQRDYWLPAAGYAVVLMLVWGIGYAIFRSKNVGAMGWFLPIVVAVTLAALGFRRLCQEVGVLTDRETYDHGKRVTGWLVIASLIGMSVVERSVGTGVLNTLLGGILFVTLLALVLFALKTKLLMDGETDRAEQERMSLTDLNELRARYRRDKGLKELPKDQYDHRMGRDAPMPELPAVGRAGVYEPAYTRASAQPSSAPASLERTMPLRPSAPAPLSPSQAGASSPGPLSDAELQAKIREVRKQALKAQRAAGKPRSP